MTDQEPITTNFPSSLQKLKRASFHIETFFNEADIFFAEHVGIKSVPWQNNREAIVACISKPIPEEWPCIIGDAIHNMRATLDHMVWEAVRLNKQVSTLNNFFPIVKDITKADRRVRASIKGVSQGIADHIRKTITDKSSMNILQLLHECDNTDKHRSLMPVITTYERFTQSWRIGGFTIPVGLTLEPLSSKEVQNGSFLYSPGEFTPDLGVSDDIEISYQFSFSLCFDKNSPAKGQDIKRFLAVSYDLIHRIMVMADEIAEREPKLA